MALIGYFRSRSNKRQENADETFWETEANANLTRRQDITTLPYIRIPMQDLPLGNHPDDDALSRIEAEVQALSKKDLLNLTGKTNTDLKLAYGAPNLPSLMDSEHNFTMLLRLYQEWASRLYELSYLSEATQVLEQAIYSGSDIKGSYELLVRIYKETGQESKIPALKTYADQLNTLMKKSILALIETNSSEINQ
jgi:hypothetical protein